jgi:hypothetical protein
MNVWARWMAVARKWRRGGRESWGAKAFKKQSEEDGREGSLFWLPPQKASLGREREVWLNDERALRRRLHEVWSSKEPGQARNDGGTNQRRAWE